MNKMHLRELTDEYVEYEYYPEGEGVPGIVRMNFSDDYPIILKRAETPSVMHANHALSAVKKCVLNREFPDIFTNAWY